MTVFFLVSSSPVVVEQDSQRTNLEREMEMFENWQDPSTHEIRMFLLWQCSCQFETDIPARSRNWDFISAVSKVLNTLLDACIYVCLSVCLYYLSICLFVFSPSVHAHIYSAVAVNDSIVKVTLWFPLKLMSLLFYTFPIEFSLQVCLRISWREK